MLENPHKVTTPPFALTPGHANGNIFIDYTLVTVIKIFNSASDKIPETFDGDPKGMNQLNNTY